jgi:hypothetical protein
MTTEMLNDMTTEVSTDMTTEVSTDMSTEMHFNTLVCLMQREQGFTTAVLNHGLYALRCIQMAEEDVPDGAGVWEKRLLRWFLREDPQMRNMLNVVHPVPLEPAYVPEKSRFHMPTEIASIKDFDKRLQAYENHIIRWSDQEDMQFYLDRGYSVVGSRKTFKD